MSASKKDCASESAASFSDPRACITRAIVAGDRDFDDYTMLSDNLNRILAGRGYVEIVSGHAGGTDLLGERYAGEHGIPYTVFPADWKRYHTRAGFIRNTQMLEYASEKTPLVVAFWDGTSHGTKDTIDKAEKAGVECIVIRYGGYTDTGGQPGRENGSVKTVLGVPVEEFVKQNADKTLAEALGDEHFWYSYYRIESLGLSRHSYICLRRFMDPPVCRPSGSHLTMDELLGFKVRDLWNGRVIFEDVFVEVVEKADAWLKARHAGTES